MDAIRNQMKNPLVVGVLGLVVGAIFGLVVLGWWLFPVEWVNAYPEHLILDQKVEYLRMAIEAYGQNGDQAKAKARYQALGSEADEALATIAKDPQGLSNELLMSFSEVVASVQPETEKAPPAKKTTNVLWHLIPILCVIALVVAAVLVYLFLLRGKRTTGEAPTPAQIAEEQKKKAPWTDYAAEGAEPPMAQFMASYKYGDNLFDDSFSIETPAGEFLGECGVGISETIGVGDPKRVSAFEVWLFDKNDIQTVTKVLMSVHAFEDTPTRQRLAAKGEPILAEPGTETVLETQTLQLVARVVDMGYGEGALPERSFFDRLTLELAIWPKYAA